MTIAKGKSDLPKAKARWLCGGCGHVCYDKLILTAPNPFDAGDTVNGCPECKAVDSFTRACGHDGCLSEASVGTPGAFGFRYVWTCWKHSPNNPNHETPRIVAEQ